MGSLLNVNQLKEDKVYIQLSGTIERLISSRGLLTTYI